MGIKTQYVKRQCLARNLPEEVNQQMKGLLRKLKDEAGATPYLDLKKALLLQFGQSAEDAFEKALGLVVTSTPSALAKKMCDYICKNAGVLLRKNYFRHVAQTTATYSA